MTAPLPRDTADYGPPYVPADADPDTVRCRNCGRLAVDHSPGRYSVHGVCPR